MFHFKRPHSTFILMFQYFDNYLCFGNVQDVSPRPATNSRRHIPGSCSVSKILTITHVSATFAIFTLTIIHFKRQQKPEKTAADCLLNGGGLSTLIDGVSPSSSAVLAHVQVDSDIFTARVFTTSWSLDMGWGGVTLCVLTSVLWILLSKIMRYSPLSMLFT